MYSAYIALGFGTLLSGLSPILVRLSPLDPGSTACWRLLIAAILSCLFARARLRLPMRTLLWLLGAGFLLAADLVLWNIAIVTTTILEATLLVMLYPLLVIAIETLFFKQPIRWSWILGGLIAFSGVVVMTIGPGMSAFEISEAHFIGNLLAVIAAFFYAGCLLITARICQVHNIQAVTFWELLMAGIFSLPMIFWEADGVPTNLSQAGFLLFYGLMTFAGYFLINKGLSKVSASVTAILSYAQPVIASVIAFFVLSEVPHHIALVGAGVVLLGLGLAARSKKAKLQVS